MKYFAKLSFLAVLLIGFFTACEKKVGDLPYYQPGTAVTLSSSSSTVAAAPADSSKVALTLTWSNPKYSVDSSTVKYIVEIDSSGRNFSKSVSRTLSGALTTSFTAKDLNAILLGYGFSFGVAYDMNIRITSSYANNNELLRSNVIKVKMTPYKIPPKVTPPASGRLFIVGSATAGGWNNPVPAPTQEFTKIDSVTYGGIFNLTGGNEYLLLPVNGDWSHKFSVADKTVASLNAGGSFGADLNDNIPGPATSGRYKIIVDFQAGKFTVTPYTGVLPSNLFIVGDATPGGWNNPVPVPSQQFTQVNSTQFELALSLTGGKQYLFLPVNGDWSHKFAVPDNTIPSLKAGGTFAYDASSNLPGPDASGNYKFVVRFIDNSYTVTKQ
ncbi:SusE outer membrane protein [Hydrobacter penzbergensis]|uniref:SusE outer membrane protein n=1 Tax=Hydrobacter penzbergensis TaxID=1235997 RepID=A0A8X8IH25_9BACT|nr:SusE domain-containing protein [Hydrobacter penzbergensis]SDX45090.1 SusE outer membrane protein [Hydrobacter penzbergensis]